MLSLLGHFLLPRQSNNHRARALHVDALFFYVVIFTVVHFGVRWLHQSYPEVLGYATDIRVEELLRETNEKRQASGLPSLTFNEQLSRAAALKASDMIAKNYWAHNTPDGKSPWDFIVSSGYKYTVAGENLAKNFSNSQGVVDAWMASATHRDNILKSSYRDIGFAVVNGVIGGEETTLVVQMFGASGGQISALPERRLVSNVSAQVPGREVTPVPSKELAKEVSPQPLVISQEAISDVRSEEVALTASGVPGFLSVLTKPVVDIPSATRSLALSFALFILIVFVVDALVVSKRRIVRITGHNVAHIIFLGAFFIAGIAVGPGNIL